MAPELVMGTILCFNHFISQFRPYPYKNGGSLMRISIFIGTCINENRRSILPFFYNFEAAISLNLLESWEFHLPPIFTVTILSPTTKF